MKNVIGDAYYDTTLYVDDRESNLQKYRLAMTGHTSEHKIVLQVTTLDLVKGLVEGNFATADLSMLDQKCISDLRLNEDLIVIRCNDDHSLSFLQIKERQLVLIFKIKIVDQSS